MEFEKVFSIGRGCRLEQFWMVPGVFSEGNCSGKLDGWNSFSKEGCWIVTIIRRATGGRHSSSIDCLGRMAQNYNRGGQPLVPILPTPPVGNKELAGSNNYSSLPPWIGQGPALSILQRPPPLEAILHPRLDCEVKIGPLLTLFLSS